MIKKAVELGPANGAYLDSLGWAYFRLGKYELAEDCLTKASQHIWGWIRRSRTTSAISIRRLAVTGKLAAAHWERAVDEWNKTVPAEVDTDGLAKVTQKLESAKMRLAKEEPGNK